MPLMLMGSDAKISPTGITPSMFGSETAQPMLCAAAQ